MSASFFNKIYSVVGNAKKDAEQIERRVVVPNSVDVKEIRDRLRMTQESFAETFGFTVNSVRNWEQGRRTPEGPARILLSLIAANPDAILETLHETA